MTEFSLGAVVLAVIAVVQAVLFAQRRIGVSRSARETWELAGDSDPESRLGLDEAAYVRAYVRTYGPRGPIYVLLAAAAAAAITPVAAVALNGAWMFLWRLAGRPDAFDQGYLIWQFYMYFGVLFAWLGAAGLVVRLYHARRPGTLEEELNGERRRSAEQR